MTIADIDAREIERRKEHIRRLWAYRKVDHIPVGVWLDDFSEYTLREQCESGEIQFHVNVRCIEKCLSALSDDYIPYARVWPGYITIGTLFGIPVYWSDDPNQAPGLQEHPVTEISQVYNLTMPDPKTAGLMPHNLRWLGYTASRLPECVSITGIDLGGPINTAKDMLDTNLLYTAFYDDPDAFHFFLNMVTDLQIACYHEIIGAVGSIDRLTCIDFDPLWAPEGRKGFVSDDVCASFGPDMFREFSVPYNNRIFRAFTGGRIHNCGPHPSIHHYLDHDPGINGLNCSFRYSRSGLGDIKESFEGRGIVEFNFDCGETHDEIVAGYEDIANTLAPDVIAIPLLFLDHTWTESDITALYRDLRKISDRYAREIRWAGGV